VTAVADGCLHGSLILAFTLKIVAATHQNHCRPAQRDQTLDASAPYT
jgi:hypothetical protein